MKIYSVERVSFNYNGSCIKETVATFTSVKLAKLYVKTAEADSANDKWTYDILELNTSSNAYLVENIQWDCDGETPNLPKTLLIPSGKLPTGFNDVEESISEYLTNTYGFCHKGFDYQDIITNEVCNQIRDDFQKFFGIKLTEEDFTILEDNSVEVNYRGDIPDEQMLSKIRHSAIIDSSSIDESTNQLVIYTRLTKEDYKNAI